MTIVKYFTSDRTDGNGILNKAYDEYKGYMHDRDIEEDSYVSPPKELTTVMDMNKDELITYALDMYGLKFTKGMAASMMIKKMYEHTHGVEVSKRGRPKKEGE